MYPFALCIPSYWSINLFVSDSLLYFCEWNYKRKQLKIVSVKLKSMHVFCFVRSCKWSIQECRFLERWKNLSLHSFVMSMCSFLYIDSTVRRNRHVSQNVVMYVLKTTCLLTSKKENNKQTPWCESTNELYRPSDCRWSAKLVPTFTDRECHVVSVTDPYGRILGFLDWSRYNLFQVAPQLYSRSWVDPVPDPLLLRKSGSAGNRSRTSGPVARNSDH
jgi:hypothetical protein